MTNKRTAVTKKLKNVKNMFDLDDDRFDEDVINGYLSSLRRIMMDDKKGKVVRCSRGSLKEEIIKAIQLNLRIDPSYSHGYICPMEIDNQMVADFRIMYQGWVKLAYDNRPDIEHIDGGVIRENDEYDYSKGSGSNYFLKIKKPINNRGDVVGGWAQAYVEGSKVDPYIIKGKGYLNKVREASPQPGGIWNDWAGEMIAAKMLSYLCRKRLSIKNEMSPEQVRALSSAEHEHADPNLSGGNHQSNRNQNKQNNVTVDRDRDNGKDKDDSDDNLLKTKKKKTLAIARNLGMDEDQLAEYAIKFRQGKGLDKDEEFYDKFYKHVQDLEKSPYNAFCIDCDGEVEGVGLEKREAVCEDCKEKRGDWNGDDDSKDSSENSQDDEETSSDGISWK